MYRVLIAEPVDVMMSSWDLPDDIRRSMEDILRYDLGADPVKALVRVEGLVAGEKLNVFSFTIPEPPVAGETHLFWFSVIYDLDERSLHILDADHEGPESTSMPGPVM